MRRHFPETGPVAQTAGIRRRTLVRSTAWAVPAVASVGAAPAFAATGQTYGLTPVQVGIVSRQACSTIAANTVRFQATINPGTPTSHSAPAGESVTITLPAGLRFTDGTTTKTVPTDAAGVASVPAITPYGAAGTYSISATWRGQTATYPVTVTPQPGGVIAINRTTTSSDTGATFTPTVVQGITDGLTGSIYGDQNSTSATGSGANAVILTNTGTVRHWGRDLGGTRSRAGHPVLPGQLHHPDHRHDDGRQLDVDHHR